MGKLSARRIETIKKPGRYPDGGNLYLQVGPKGTKSWAFLFMLRGRSRQMGLGPMDLNPDPAKRVGLNLADARDEAYKVRRLCWQGSTRSSSETLTASRRAARRFANAPNG